MALHQVVAGSRFYIGGTIADQNSDFAESDFSGQSWTEVDGWETMGDLGEEPNIITTSVINRNRDKAQKGTRQVVTMENRFTIYPDDAGQLACIAAEADDDNYAFRLVFPSGAQRLFIGLVVSSREIGGTANTPRMLQVNIARNSNVVKVAA
ncbi:hypothetical protein [Mesorhizobium sp. Z1-4]|uniref:hypothetical protein n=1 Tax=Mesorhizobium sp. Z1-4 TaxID=2448478 RepID=UPI000FDAF3C2|nr:hypothetical protein [Mesorhizobium sp. Z1-4]